MRLLDPKRMETQAGRAYPGDLELRGYAAAPTAARDAIKNRIASARQTLESRAIEDTNMFLMYR